MGNRIQLTLVVVVYIYNSVDNKTANVILKPLVHVPSSRRARHTGKRDANLKDIRTRSNKQLTTLYRQLATYVLPNTEP
jgi:hypothetical protein